MSKENNKQNGSTSNENMKNEKIVKSVAFSTNEPNDIRLLEFAMRNKNFSGYVKRLIQRDMDIEVMKLWEELQKRK
ncbi:hypothetical protein C2L96_21135 [Bacillus cereus]|uniref:hypothetical protein n=1 Tax=Bacillus TaxID=1386 RepID=UPI000CCC9D74|nr:hypothetical protein [Bacillus sp. BLCC-B18]MDC7975385.1 hypothetical protein [Bacillus sp. BLCC-B18]PNU10986.1 hypothetical protein C2L96_21135 [Bacillus cereus]